MPRRRVLGLALALPLGLTGCNTSTPTVDSPTGRPVTPPGHPAGATPSSAPAPVPAAPAFAHAAMQEQTLSELAGAILAGRRRDLSGAQRRLLTFVRASHGRHAAALAAPDPTAGAAVGVRPPAGAPPPLGTRTLAQALRLLADHENALAASHQQHTQSVRGLEALLWGSLAIADSSYATGVTAHTPPPVGPLGLRRPLPVLSDVEALQQLVAQLHAAVYGYQLALGQLPASGPVHARALAGLTARRALLDSLSDRLVALGLQVPAGEPAYAAPVAVHDAATAAQLVRHVESALLPFCGLWLAAAASPADRAQALGAVRATVATARQWGAPLLVWPGWPATH